MNAGEIDNKRTHEWVAYRVCNCLSNDDRDFCFIADVREQEKRKLLTLIHDLIVEYFNDREFYDIPSTLENREELRSIIEFEWDRMANRFGFGTVETTLG